MKRFKNILMACILALAVFALTACGAKKADYSDNDEEYLYNAYTTLSQIIVLDDATLDAYIEKCEYEQNVPLTNGFNSWKSAKKELGRVVDYVDDGTVTYDKDGAATVRIMLEFENRNCEFIIGWDRMGQEITELTFNPEYSMGEKLGQAGTNLVIGMGTVFAVLIFLAWIISLFKYVHRAEEKAAEKKAEKEAAKAAEKKAAAPAAVPTTPAAPVQVPGMTITPAPADDELKAVIAAAVAAYEEDAGCSIEKQPSLNNGIVVKSIKRG